jgi:hypothetical protein
MRAAAIAMAHGGGCLKERGAVRLMMATVAVVV